MQIFKLHGLSQEDYTKLKLSGMFWELFPEATGNYITDMELAKADFEKVNKND